MRDQRKIYIIIYISMLAYIHSINDINKLLIHFSTPNMVERDNLSVFSNLMLLLLSFYNLITSMRWLLVVLSCTISLSFSNTDNVVIRVFFFEGDSHLAIFNLSSSHTHCLQDSVFTFDIYIYLLFLIFQYLNYRYPKLAQNYEKKCTCANY